MAVYMTDSYKLQALFQTLSDANRLLIIHFIGRQSRSVSEIVAETKLSQPLVSHHLKVLREQGVLITKREGPFIYHELKDPRILDALGIFSELTFNAEGPPGGGKEMRMFCCPDWFRKAFK
jgi:DNA-binding transcriptional ArsR family regulator